MAEPTPHPPTADRGFLEVLFKEPENPDAFREYIEVDSFFDDYLGSLEDADSQTSLVSGGQNKGARRPPEPAGEPWSRS